MARGPRRGAASACGRDERAADQRTRTGARCAIPRFKNPNTKNCASNYIALFWNFRSIDISMTGSLPRGEIF